MSEKLDEEQLSSLKLAVTVPNGANSLCGGDIRLSSNMGEISICDNNLQLEDDNTDVILAKLGGILLINGEPFGLTVSHAFNYLRRDSRSDVSDTVFRINHSNGSFESVSSLDTFGESNFEEVLTSEERPSPRTKFRLTEVPSTSSNETTESNKYKTFDASVATYELGRSNLNNSKQSLLFTEDQDIGFSLDWMLLKVNGVFDRTNIYSYCESSNAVPVTDLGTGYVHGEVSVLVKSSSPMKGKFTKTRSQPGFQTNKSAVYQIRLERPLDQEDIGAWVVQRQTLHGVIIAVSRLVPWAFVIPIATLLEKIQSSIGDCNITLPSKSPSPMTNGAKSEYKSPIERVLADQANNKRDRSRQDNTAAASLNVEPSYLQKLRDFSKMTFEGTEGEYYSTFMRYLQSEKLCQRASVVDGLVMGSQGTGIDSETGLVYASPAEELQILHIRGLPTPDLITHLGANFNVPPPFWLNHMDELCGANRFQRCELPSAIKNFVRLRLTTLGSSRLGKASKEMRESSPTASANRNTSKTYRTRSHPQLQAEIAEGGDSVVREFSSTTNGQFFLEHYISICILPAEEGLYKALICFDIGSDKPMFNRYAPSAELGGRALSEHISVRPTACPLPAHLAGNSTTSKLTGVRDFLAGHKQSIARGFNSNSMPDSSPVRKGYSTSNEPRESYTQSASRLHSTYWQGLDVKCMRINPVYAFKELFRYSAATEMQFLDSISGEITRYRDLLSLKTGQGIAVNVRVQSAIQELFRLEDMLDRHFDDTDSNWTFISAHSEKPWPVDTDVFHDDLLRDLEQIRYRNKRLRKDCKATRICLTKLHTPNLYNVQGSTQHQTFTIQAAVTVIFLPLILVTSFYGMNNAAFSSAFDTKIWSPILAAVVVMLLTGMCLVFYFWWNPGAIGRRSSKAPDRNIIELLPF